MQLARGEAVQSGVEQSGARQSALDRTVARRRGESLRDRVFR